MEQFLDSCIVIHYSNYVEGRSKSITKKCFELIERKEGKFILCCFSIEEISKYRKRQIDIHKEVIEKLKNPQHSLDNFSYFKDGAVAKQIYSFLSSKGPLEASSILKEQRRVFDLRMDYFLNNLLGEKVIPIQDIDLELVSKLYSCLKNRADCKILASAIRLQKERELFLFVTADKDFAPDKYSFLEKQFEINNKEELRFPKLKNLLFEN